MARKRQHKRLTDLADDISGLSPDDAIKVIRKAVREWKKQGYYDFRIDVEATEEPSWGGSYPVTEILLWGRPESKKKAKTP